MPVNKRAFHTVFLSLLASVGLMSCGGSGDPEKPGVPEEPKGDGVLSVLAIGNSFSVDGMEYLYEILKAAGIFLPIQE